MAISQLFPPNSPLSYSSLMASAPGALCGGAPSNPTITSASDSTSAVDLGSSFISIQSPSLKCRLMPATADGGAGLRFHFPFALRFTLIVQFFSLGDGQLHLDVAVLQIHLGRDESQAFFASAGLQLVDFRAVQQQLAATGRLMILAIAVRVLADMSIEQPG